MIHGGWRVWNEECLATKAVGFAFAGFDFVVDALELSGGDGVLSVVENAGGMGTKGLGHGDYLCDSTLPCALTPRIEMLADQPWGEMTPEATKVFFELVSRRERLVEAQRLV